jgi:hypothetical protein
MKLALFIYIKALLLFIVVFVQGWEFIDGEFPAIVYRGTFRSRISGDIPLTCFKYDKIQGFGYNKRKNSAYF